MSGDTLAEQLQRAREQRQEATRRFLSKTLESEHSAYIKILHEVLPSPERLRSLASFVDIEILRKIDDPEVIAAQFGVLHRTLLNLASALEALPARCGEKEKL